MRSAIPDLPLTLFYMAMSLVLIFTFFYDLRYLEISDWILIPGTMIALIATELAATPSLTSGLIGMGIGMAFFMIQILISKGKWVGGGDVRIGAFMGALLGWKMSFLSFLTPPIALMHSIALTYLNLLVLRQPWFMTRGVRREGRMLLLKLI